MLSKPVVLIAAASALALALAGPAPAAQFASFSPVNATPDGPTAPNIQLTGVVLNASSPVSFEYAMPGPLGAVGDLQATLTVSAVETSAVQFGAVALATFDGSFSINYAGPDATIQGLHFTTGETLLDGQFADSVFTGYGSAASLVDSLIGGGLVNFNDNSLIAFQPPGGDEGLTLGFVDLNNPARVTNGFLRAFTAVANGEFAADNVTYVGPPPSFQGVPEPAAWVLTVLGLGMLGAALRGARRPAPARP